MFIDKTSPADLAVFGGAPMFSKPRSTSNLVRPDIDVFLSYSRVFFDEHRYTNDGPLVRMLEERLAEFHQVPYCVATSNGFWALVLAIRCLALENKSEVVMPSLTYRRLADAAAWAGLVPRFCEVDAKSLAITPATVTPCLNDDTALILPVHPIVNCCEATPLTETAAEHGIPILFDSVESVYETWQGRKVGSFGGAEIFSMHASKLINGFEGGYVTTGDAGVAERLSYMRGFGFRGQDLVNDLGINAKLNEVHAAMALAGLDDLEAQVERNRGRYEAYRSQLPLVPGLRLLEFDEMDQCSFKNIVVELLDGWPVSREQLLSVLHGEHILARAYYSPPLHRKSTTYPTRWENLDETENLAERFVLLPCGNQTTIEDIEKIVQLLEFIGAHAAAIGERLRPV